MSLVGCFLLKNPRINLAIRVGVSLTWLCQFLSNFWCRVLEYGVPPSIESVSTISGIYSYYSYVNIGVGVGGGLYFALVQVMGLSGF